MTLLLASMCIIYMHHIYVSYISHSFSRFTSGQEFNLYNCHTMRIMIIQYYTKLIRHKIVCNTTHGEMFMKTITRLSTCLLAASAMTAISTPGYAQIDEEVIVTATKRASSVQDVPLAVTVLGEAQLQNQGVTSISDLTSATTGFNIQTANNPSQSTSIRIRGIGTTGNNIGLESAVGIFIDGVYQSRPGVALGELSDVEALEILKGPQGTLFGRNTSAGALNIRTKAPDFDGFSGFADFTYGNFDLLNVQAGVNFTASEQLAFRVNGAWRQRDGFYESGANPDVESHDADRFFIKGQALWEPTDVTSLRIIADYSETDEQCCDAVTLTASPNLGGAVSTIFPVLGFDDALEEGITNDNTQFESQVENFGIQAELVHDFGVAEATLIGSYRDFTGESLQGEFNASSQYTLNQLDEIETFTAELRFQGNAWDDRLDWLVGGFFSDESIVEPQNLTLGADFQSSVSLANFGTPAALGLFASSGDFLVNNDPSIFATGVSSDGATANNLFEQDATSWSIFTHNIFSVTDRLDLTLGARYNDDSKDGSFTQESVTNPDACLSSLALAAIAGGDAAAGNTTNGVSNTVFGALSPILGAATAGLAGTPAANGPGAFLNCFPFSAPTLSNAQALLGPLSAAGAGFLPQEFDDTFNDEELIYTIKLDYDLTDDVLIYGGFSHGYKAGGFNLDTTAGAGGGSPLFASEEVDSWEGGVKTTLADGRVRLNVTGFFSSFDDFQVLEFTGTNFQTFNVDDVTTQGFEIDVNANLTETISVNAGVTYADAEYGEDCDDGGAIPQAVNLCGSQLTNAPEVTSIIGVTYDGDLGQTGWGLTGNVNLSHQGDRRTSTNPGPVGNRIPFDIQDDSVKINARLGFSMPNDRARIEFWGLNITDEITRSITFNTPLQGASRSAFLQAPRQYGVTLRTNF